MTSETSQVAHLAVEALEDLKAVDIRVMDVRELTTVTDYMVVASGRSERQVRSLADHVIKRLKKWLCAIGHGRPRHGRMGLGRPW